VTGKGKVRIGSNLVEVSQETLYPWDGEVRITLSPEQSQEFTVNIRIPGWARNEPVPSDLYAFLHKNGERVVIKVNSEQVPLELTKGFARIRRRWTEGDRIELALPMSVRRIVSHQNVEHNQGLVALQRGPLVYCFEGVDNDGKVLERHLPDDAVFEVEFRPELWGGINVIKMKKPDGTGHLVAVPYYSWSHRGPGEMAVWLPRNEKK